MGATTLDMIQLAIAAGVENLNMRYRSRHRHLLGSITRTLLSRWSAVREWEPTAV
jgi:hypothetical protein